MTIDIDHKVDQYSQIFTSSDGVQNYVQTDLRGALGIVGERVNGNWDKDLDPSQPDDSSLTNSSSARWDDNTNLKGAIKYAMNGWSKGQKALDNINGEIPALATVKSNTRRIKYSSTTGTPTVGRYLVGNPKYWRQRTRTTREVIDLCVPIGALSNWGAKELKNRGLAIVALIEKLERDGKAVSISAYHTSSYHDERIGKDAYFGYEIDIKKAGQNMDQDLIMFVLAHPAFMRRIGFAVKEYYNPTCTRRGYGSTTYAHGDVVKTASISRPLPSKIYLANMGDKSDFETAQGAFDFVCRNVENMIGKNKQAA